jgi:transposase
MNGKRKRVYLKPESKVIQVSVEHLLQAVSGQHKHIGQGGTYGDAKRSNVEWGEWDDENQNAPIVTNEDNE